MATLIEKALRGVAETVQKASRGSLSSYVLNAPHQYGQPLPQQADAQSLITPARMREIVLKTPTAGAAMNAILDFAGEVPLVVRNVDPAIKTDDGRVKYLEGLLRTPNPNDHARRFKVKLLRDLATLGYAGVEIEPGKGGSKVANLWVLDAGKLFVDYDQHGTNLGYNMLDAHGYPIAGPDGVHAWLPEEVLWFELNPMSNSLYPSSRISQLFTCAVIEDLMIAFIGGKFTESNVPFGVLGLGDVSKEELKKAVAIWNEQATSQHRIQLTGSKGNLQWVPFGYHLKDLEARYLLEEVRGKIMAVMGVTMNELGESQDVNKSNGFNLSYTFKRRAIEPLLGELCEVLTTRLIWETFGWTDLELTFQEIDSRDELLQAQIDDMYFKNGVWSVNQIANRKGEPNIPGGDLHVVFTGSAYIPVDKIEDFATAQLEALQAINKQTEVATEQAEAAGQAGQPLQPLGSEPMVRPPQPPEKFTTPDGSGSSTPKFKLPKPSLKPPAAATGQTQKPRGGVQTLRNAGVRKEDLRQ
jgi:hypothetical protein